MRSKRMVVCLFGAIVSMCLVSQSARQREGLAWAQTESPALSDWLYPGAVRFIGSGGKGGGIKTGIYLTADDLKTVVEFYVRKANVSENALKGLDGPAPKLPSAVIYGGDANSILIERNAEASRVVVTVRGDKKTISAFISRAANEDQTRIILVAEDKSPPLTADEIKAEFERQRAESLKVLKEWEFPRAKSGGGGGGDTAKAALYTTPESLRSVCDFYAKKMGASVPAGFFDAPFNAAGARDYVMSSDRRAGAHTVTFTKRAGKELITVLISRADHEEETHMTLMREVRESDTPNSTTSDDLVKEWECAGAKRQAFARAGVFQVGVYTTLESLQSIWEAYYMKVVNSGPHAHGLRLFGSRGGVTGFGATFLGNTKRPELHAATFARRIDKYAVTVFLSRGEIEGETHVTIITEEK